MTTNFLVPCQSIFRLIQEPLVHLQVQTQTLVNFLLIFSRGNMTLQWVRIAHSPLHQKIPLNQKVTNQRMTNQRVMNLRVTNLRATNLRATKRKATNQKATKRKATKRKVKNLKATKERVQSINELLKRYERIT